jgi:hypothetical protein
MNNLGHICFAAAAIVAAATLPFAAHAADVNSEIMNARMHAGLAAQGSDVGTVHTHLHHTLNCLVGPNGTGFDSKELNPCKGSGDGAITDEPDAGKKKALQAAADKTSAGIADGDLAGAQKDAASVVTMLSNVK